MRWLPILLLCGGLSAAVAEDELTLARLLAAEGDQRQTILRQLFAATPVDLAAGTYSLRQAMEQLDPDHAGILLELGIDETAQGTMAGYSGDWWGAALHLCRSFSLEPAPPQPIRKPIRANPYYYGYNRNTGETRKQRLFGDPVQLRRTERLGRGSIVAAAHANGSLLVEFLDIAATDVRRLQGNRQNVDLLYRLRLQPDLRADLVDHAVVTWAKATADNGSTLDVLTKGEVDILLAAIRNNKEPNDPTSNRHRYNRYRNRDTIRPTAKIRLDKVPTGSRWIDLEGTVTLSCRSELKLHAELALGETTTIEAAPIPITCHLRKNDEDQRRGAFWLSVSYRPRDLATAPVVVVTAPDGSLIHSRSTGSSSDGSNRTIDFHLANVGAGKHRIDLTCTVDLGDVTLPLRGRVELP